MKRRNFFSKIAKCLLGIGIIKALPTPEVETAVSETPQNVSTPELDRELNILRQTLNRTYTITGADSPKGIIWDGKRYIISENVDD